METTIRQLGAMPFDLAAGAVALGAVSRWFFVENSGLSALRFRETATEPALADPGHGLAAGDAVVLMVVSTPLWLWSPDGDGQVTISDGAAAPVRTA